MSFLCRPGVFKQPSFTKPESAGDVPYGLTEEYIRRFWFGCGNGPNFIDSLHEYWLDWAGLKKMIYRHQALFPWDCTQSFLRYPGKCGNCTMAKHLWAFPFDSWSIIALHLSQDRFLYPENAANAAKDVDVSWMRCRLTLLTALDTLCAGATAMSQEPLFHQATAWLHTQTDPTVERVKLGSIHRAQPRSHVFDKRPYDEFLLAPWMRMVWLDHIQWYEKVREQFRAPELRWEYNERELEKIDKVYQQHTPARVVPVSKGRIPNAGFTASKISPGVHVACGTQSSAGGCASNCASCKSGCGGGCGGNGGGGCGGGCGGGSGGGGSGGGG